MGERELLDRFSNLKVWKRGSQRAPHKPLLVLYALGQMQRGIDRLLPFKQVDEELGKLLDEFGRPGKRHHPEYPFWRLQNDMVWEVPDGESLAVRESNSDPRKSELLARNCLGGFTEEVFDVLSRNPMLVQEIVRDLLVGHFSSSIHEDILTATGLAFEIRAQRDPSFRSEVLDAYEHRCVVCGHDLQLCNRDMGLEAAHIKWHAAGGPDRIENGLALCSLHHKAFDLGALAISPTRQFLVSEKARGGPRFEELLMRYHGAPISDPIRDEYAPASEYIEWHQREVFRGPSRALV